VIGLLSVIVDGFVGSGLTEAIVVPGSTNPAESATSAPTSNRNPGWPILVTVRFVRDTPAL
jgi:hypothetical protein